MFYFNLFDRLWFYRFFCSLLLAAAHLSTSEEKGEINGERIIFSKDDIISLSIEYLPQDISSYFYIPLIKSTTKLGPNGYPLNGCDDHNQRRYLSCEGAMKVYHLKR